MTTIRRSISEIAKKATGPSLRKGYLADDYDGIGSTVQVMMSRGSTSAVQAYVSAGDYGTEQVFPAGTPVYTLEHEGRLEVVSMGSKMGAGTITADMISNPGLDASIPDTPVIAPGTLPGTSLAAGSITTTEIGESAIQTPQLAANSIEAIHFNGKIITADQIISHSLTLDVLESDIILVENAIKTGTEGARVEIDDAGIRNYSDQEELTVNIPTDGSPVKVVGDVEASSFIATNGAEIRTTSLFAAGSITTLEGGISNPGTPPTLISSLDSLTLPVAPPYVGEGIYYDPNGGPAGGVPSYWVGANPLIGNLLDMAYEYNASTGALLRTLRKTGTSQTLTATAGATSHVADITVARSGSTYSQIGTPITLPDRDNIQITKVSAYLAGWGGSAACRVAVWNTSGTVLRQSSTFTVNERTFSNGNDVQYNKSLSSPVAVAGGATIWAGFLHTDSGDGFFWSQDQGSGKTEKRGDGLGGDMTSIETFSDQKPNVYVTYTYEVDTAEEGDTGKIIGVVRAGSYVWLLDSNGWLFKYNQSDLNYLGKFNLSGYINGTKANAGLFYDGTDLRITSTDGITGNDSVKLVRVNASTGAYISSFTLTGLTTNGSTSIIRGAHFDGTHYWIPVSGTVYAFLGTNGANVANRHFGTAASALSGITHDGTQFRGYASGNPTKIWKFTNWDWTTESDVYWVGYSWYDSNATGGTHETALSPRSSITMRRRERLQITTPAVPVGGTDDPDLVRLYLARGASQPAAGSYWLNVTHGGTTYILSSFTGSGTNDLTSSSFGGGVPAEMKSAVAGWSLMGDGAWVPGVLPGVYIPANLSSGSLADGTAIDLSFTSEPAGTRDPYSMHDTATNPSRFTIPSALGAGLYRISWYVDAGTVASSSGPLRMLIKKNGTETWRDEPFIGNSAAYRFARTWLADLAVNDYVEFRLQNNTGVSRTIVTGSVAIEKVSI